MKPLGATKVVGEGKKWGHRQVRGIWSIKNHCWIEIIESNIRIKIKGVKKCLNHQTWGCLGENSSIKQIRSSVQTSWRSFTETAGAGFCPRATQGFGQAVTSQGMTSESNFHFQIFVLHSGNDPATSKDFSSHIKLSLRLNHPHLCYIHGAILLWL